MSDNPFKDATDNDATVDNIFADANNDLDNPFGLPTADKKPVIDDPLDFKSNTEKPKAQTKQSKTEPDVKPGPFDEPTQPNGLPTQSASSVTPSVTPFPASKSPFATQSTAPKATSTSAKPKHSSAPKRSTNYDKSKFPEGARELYVEALYINRTDDKNDPFSIATRLRFRRDVEGDKPLAGGYVTRKSTPRQPHVQSMKFDAFKRIVEANNLEMPTLNELGKHADSHYPIFTSNDNIAFKANVFYPNSKLRGSDKRPVDLVSPKSITATEHPFSMYNERKADNKHRSAWKFGKKKAQSKAKTAAPKATQPAMKAQPNKANQSFTAALDMQIKSPFQQTKPKTQQNNLER